MNLNRRQTSARAQTADIHVAWRNDRKAWLVTRSGELMASKGFRYREHAVAFARAVAASRDAELVVSETDGKEIRHSRDTLSYPKELD